MAISISSAFGNSKALGGLKASISKGTALFKNVSGVINAVAKSPITRFVGDKIPALQPLINKTNVANEKLKSIGNSLEKAEKKIQEVESAINFH